MTSRFFLAFASAIAISASSSAVEAARLKDLVEVEGVRGNDLVGYGLVVGLNGTGDGLRNSPYTQEALSSFLERLGVNVTGEDFRPRNIAAVVVTATLPPFARQGMQVDVTVSAIGDATNLRGGTLVLTPLSAADGKIYAVAQGSILASGFSAQGAAASVTEGVPTVATVPNGARVERELPFDFDSLKTVHLSLRSPDFTTAERIEQAINAKTGKPVAKMLDATAVEVAIDGNFDSPARMLSALENLDVQPAQKARVVVDQRSGTIVLGSDVQISAVAVAQGSLAIRINETPQISQPNPFSQNGETVSVPRTDIAVDDKPKNIAVLRPNVTLSDLVSGLNALGVSPREMIDILKAIKAAGALQAELIVQ